MIFEQFREATIVTERLVLTPLRVEDAEAMVDVLGDEKLYEFIGGRPEGPAELGRRYARLVAGSGRAGEVWLNWIVRVAVGRRPVGTVQATVGRLGDGCGASVAWVVGVPWQGRGFATEAARGLVGWLRGRGVSAVSAAVHPDHHASAGVAAGAGLVVTDEVVDGERIWRTPPWNG